VSIIALCTAVFLWQMSLGNKGLERVVYGFGVVPAVLFEVTRLDPRLIIVAAGITVLSSMFLHGGWSHLIGNVLYLWIFADNVEDAMGRRRFVIYYLLCGVVAALSRAFIAPGSRIPVIGASETISGVLGAYLLFFPHARVLVLLQFGFSTRAFYVSAMLVLDLRCLLQIFGSLAAQSGQGVVTWFALVVRFSAGMILVPDFKNRTVQLFNPARCRRK